MTRCSQLLTVLTLLATWIVKAPAQDYFWVEAEQTSRDNFPSSTWLHPSNQQERDALANNGLLSSINPDTAYWAEYDLVIPADGNYKVYARRDYNYGVFVCRFDGNGTWLRAGADLQRMDSEQYKQYFPMNWIQVGSTNLTAGSHVFRVEVKAADWPSAPENGYLDKVAIDAFMIARESFVPRGKLRPDQKYNLAEPGKWNFEPDPDPHTTNAVIDLSNLNEDVAGQSGYVTHTNGKFLLGNGQPTRFWGVGSNVSGPDVETVNAHARFLAKRGVNLVRFHTTIPAMDPTEINAIDQAKLDRLHRVVAGMKQEGIYVKISWFFILALNVRANWGIDGYTSDTAQPFAVHMVDEDLRAAYKEWLTRILTPVNPYTGISLAQDPAVALIEIQNEDSFFFWTFAPSGWPTEQQQKIDDHFGQYLVDRYGSIAAAITAWGGQPFDGNISSRDNQGIGRMTVADAWYMTVDYDLNERNNRRIADQIRFLAEFQRDFYAEMRDHIHNTLGCQALIEACNWHTADKRVLQDIERYTYAVTDVIDRHFYFAGPHTDPSPPDSSSYSVQTGDYYYSEAVVNQPRRMPAAYKHVAGHPSIVSENTWPHPNLYSAEGPLLIAAYAALQDVDGWIWFATSAIRYEDTVTKFPLAIPTLMGQFPGAALLYRRGDVTEAPVVVRDNRILTNMFKKVRSLISETSSYDPNRDDPQFDPQTGEGQIDPLTFMVGRVECAYTNAPDVVNDNIFDLIDTNACVVESLPTTGESGGQLMLNWTSGVCRVNTPRCQGATGFLREPVDLSDVMLLPSNQFSAIMVIALDNRPLAQSKRVLIQAATDCRPYGWTEADQTFSYGGTSYNGKRIVNMGQPPMNVSDIAAAVQFKGKSGVQCRAAALDLNGYEKAPLNGTLNGDTYSVPLPADTLYTAVYFDYTNNPPAATLIEPAPGAVFCERTNLLLRATASVDGGTITQVRFMRNGELLAQTNSEPYAWTWTAVPQGTHQLTVSATDNRLRSVTSAVTFITVQPDWDRDWLIDDLDADDDNDGMPDNWELHYGLNRTNAQDRLADGDADTIPNWAEYITDTHPDVSNAPFGIDAVTCNDTGLVLTVRGITGRLYDVQYANDPRNGITWSAATSAIPGVAGNMQLQTRGPSRLRLHRIRIRMQE